MTLYRAKFQRGQRIRREQQTLIGVKREAVPESARDEEGVANIANTGRRSEQRGAAREGKG